MIVIVLNQFSNHSSYIIQMKQVIIIFVVLLLHSTNAQLTSQCPLYDGLQWTADTLTISTYGNVGLVQGKDINCYNYTLKTPFKCNSNIAIAVSDLQNQYSNNLFFSIKSFPSENFGIIPFIIRTHWSYTRWTKITFSFFAEASDQLQAGYYQIDTGSLSACSSGKALSAFIPYVSSNSLLTSALVFLNGFEISSVLSSNTYYTPFEMQIIISKTNYQSIEIFMTSTSATQVHSIFVSYLVYNPNMLNLVAGNYVYNTYFPSNYLTFRPPIGITNNNLAFHGFTGFIIKNQQRQLTFTGSLNNGNLIFSTNSNYYYLSYSYFYFIGGPCGQCPGYSISFEGKCHKECPAGSFYNGVTCVICLSGQVWDPRAKQCVISEHAPSCPVGTYWDQQQLRCLPCSQGCIKCIDCYSCQNCASGFFLNQLTQFCNEICGDGRRFNLACDDGNTRSGDGCSQTCQIESGFFCAGGSPNSRDVCSNRIPTNLIFSSSGQSHQWGKIILTVRVNYLPQNLISSATDCRNKCNDILSVKIINGDKSAVSIKAQYIQHSSFSFSILFDFSKEPIGLFTAQIGIKQRLVSLYFQGINTSNKLLVNINPATLAILDPSLILNNSNDLL